MGLVTLHFFWVVTQVIKRLHFVLRIFLLMSVNCGEIPQAFERIPFLRTTLHVMSSANALLHITRNTTPDPNPSSLCRRAVCRLEQQRQSLDEQNGLRISKIFGTQ